MDGLLVAALTFAGLAVGGLVTWLGTRRVNSGDIDTTQAVTLWNESTLMRDTLRDDLKAMSVRLDATTARLDVATDRITELLHQVEISRAETAVAQAAELTATTEAMKLRVAVEAVHADVRTGNALSIGALADNTESRRIADKPAAERTAAENEHIDTVGIVSHTPGGNP